ncbi:hypothetical protein KBD59_01700 [Candidatus Gracilibacteria bacterium]|nr:hypothetical protein [Candidatus Gracilibacteria bacterium]
MKKNVITWGVIIVVVGVIGFFGGMRYGQSRSTSDVEQRFAQFGANGGAGAFRAGGMMGRGGTGGGMNGSGLVMGTVLSKDDKSITLQMRDNGSRIVFFSDTTDITHSVKGTPTDVAVGSTIAVSGTTNSDGSLTAQTLQIRPMPVTPAPSTSTTPETTPQK